MNSHFDEAIKSLKKAADRLLREDARKTLEFADIFDKIAKFSGDEQHKAMGCRVKGNAHLFLREHKKAMEYYEQAASIYHKSDNHTEENSSLIGKIHALSSLGKFDEALKVGNRLYNFFKEQDDSESIFKVTKNLAQIYQRIGQYQKGIDILIESETSLQNKESDFQLAEIHRNKGNIYKYIGQLESAKQSFQLAKKIYQRLNYEVPIAIVASELGEIERRKGNIINALHIFEESCEQFEKMNRFDELAWNKLRACNCYLNLNLLSEALDTYTSLIPKLEEQAEKKSIKRILAHFEATAGIIANKFNKFDKALEHFFRASQIFDELNDDLRQIKIKVSSGITYRKKHEFKKAYEQFQDAVDFLSQKKALRELARAELQLAITEIEMGKIDEARNHLLSALTHGKYSPYLISDVYYQLGRLDEKTGDTKSALGNYLNAIEAIEKIAYLLAGHDIFQSSYFAKEVDIYQNPIEIFIKQGDIESAFQLVERTKSRTLAQLISRGFDLKKYSDSPLILELNKLKEKLNSLYSFTEDEHFREITIAQPIKEEIIVVEREIKQVVSKLYSEHKRDLPFIAPESPLVFNNLKSQIMAGLDSETIILEYFFVKGELYLFLITSKGIELYPLDVTEKNIARKLKKFNFYINKVKLQKNDNHISTQHIDNVLIECYQFLMEPVIAELQNIKNIIFIPHSILHAFPFHLLYDGDSYLMEKYAISYAPSLQILNYCHQKIGVDIFTKPAKSLNPLIMAYNPGDIPSALEEARTLHSMFPESKYCIQDKAVITNLKEYANQADFIHLITHGQFRHDNPLFSSLQFASKDSPASDYLTVHDIYHIRIKPTLVTLSGCSTGKNLVDDADNLMGLVRGFFVAGATTLLVSLWSVDDATTSELMKLFYKKVLDGEQFNQALRTAQIQIKKNTPHPFFWGGFVVVGNPFFCLHFFVSINKK